MTSTPSPTIDDRIRPGDLGAIATMHGVEYARIAGLGLQFEALVARGLGEFALRNDPDSRLWIARGADGTVLGSIAADLSGGPDDAHLR